MGWIKLHRKMTEWGWYGDTNTTRVFLHLLLTANYEPSEFRGRMVERGQSVFGLQSLAKSLRLTIKQVRVALEHLKRTNEVAIEGTNKFSIATIVKYDVYQCNDEQEGKQEDKQEDKPTANKGQTEGKQRATSKNIRREEDKNFKKPFGEFGNLKMTDGEMARLRERFPTIIDTELQAADGWIQSKGLQRKYTDWYAFLRNWCSKKQPTQPATPQGRDMRDLVNED